jgi:hypothetical protein
MSRKLGLGRTCLAGVVALLAMASQAQAQLFRWHCRPQPPCIEELTKPPVIGEAPSRAPTPAPTPAVPTPAVPTPVVPTPAVPEPALAPITTAALGDSFTSVPQIMGDFGGYCARRTVNVPVVSTVVTVINQVDGQPIITTERLLTFREVVVCDPIAARAGSGFKVADNESPTPTDRVFFTYNYFNNIGGGEGGSVERSITVTPIPTGFVITDLPGATVPSRSRDVHRELFGFEKTFLGGDASVELRLPLFQTNRDDAFNADDFGDLTVLGKYAFINNPVNVFSVGLAVTAPTGPAINTIAGDINSTLLQPFFGYIRRSGNFYFQGIHSVVFPTNSEDVNLLFNDLSVGYIFEGRGRALAFFAPNFEVHVTTPLENRNRENAVVHVSDIVTLNTGVHLGLGEGRTLLSFGVATPVTGPRPMDIEAYVQLNFRF